MRPKAALILFNPLAETLLYELPDKPYHQTSAYDGKDDAGDPAAAYSKQVSYEAADESADDAQDQVLQNAALVAQINLQSQLQQQTLYLVDQLKPAATSATAGA